jgi:hypothetical protein
LRFSGSESLGTFKDLKMKRRGIEIGQVLVSEVERKRGYRETYFSDIGGIRVRVSRSDESFRDEYLRTETDQ